MLSVNPVKQKTTEAGKNELYCGSEVTKDYSALYVWTGHWGFLILSVNLLEKFQKGNQKRAILIHWKHKTHNSITILKFVLLNNMYTTTTNNYIQKYVHLKK